MSMGVLAGDREQDRRAPLDQVERRRLERRVRGGWKFCLVVEEGAGAAARLDRGCLIGRRGAPAGAVADVGAVATDALRTPG